MMYRILFFLILTASAVLPAADIAALYRDGKFQDVINHFYDLPAGRSQEYNKAAYFAILAMCGQKDYQRGLGLSEKMAKASKSDNAWHYRFKFNQMEILKELNRPQDALKIISDADDVPPALKGEFYCLRGNLLEQDGQWRQAVEAYDWGAQTASDFAGRARFWMARSYEKNGFPLPALEAYLQTLSMLHATPADRLRSFRGAARLIDKVDRSREEVQDVLQSLQSEMKLLDAAKLYGSGDKAGAFGKLDEISGDAALPLSLREFTQTLRRAYEKQNP